MKSKITVFLTVGAAIFTALLFSGYFSANDKIDTISLIEKRGYHGEVYYVSTADGYILGLHRLLKTKNAVPKGKPVLLIHGMLGGSAIWITGYADKALSYILLKMGYDVWIGNVRGTNWSRNHSSLNPEKDQQFWDYSFHEIGVYDLPAMINYILNETAHKDLFYVGHSQGTTSFFVMTSVLPEMNKKIRLSVNLAPAVIYKENLFVPSLYIKIVHVSLRILKFFGVAEFPIPAIQMPLNKIFCSGKLGSNYMCKLLMKVMTVTLNEQDVELEQFPTVLQTTPDTASIKQLLHYHQLSARGKFEQYDYGSEENLSKYGQKDPPEYNLLNIDVPLALYYGKGDVQVYYKDVETLIKKMGDKIVRKYLVPFEKFDHGDFLFAKNVVPLLYNDIVKLIETYTL